MKQNILIKATILERQGSINNVIDKITAPPNEMIKLLKQKYQTKKDVFTIAAEEYNQLIQEANERRKT